METIGNPQKPYSNPYSIPLKKPYSDPYKGPSKPQHGLGEGPEIQEVRSLQGLRADGWKTKLGLSLNPKP